MIFVNRQSKAKEIYNLHQKYGPNISELTKSIECGDEKVNNPKRNTCGKNVIADFDDLFTHKIV